MRPKSMIAGLQHAALALLTLPMVQHDVAPRDGQSVVVAGAAGAKQETTPLKTKSVKLPSALTLPKIQPLPPAHDGDRQQIQTLPVAPYKMPRLKPVQHPINSAH